MVLLFKGGRGILTAEERATPASVTSATPSEGIERFNEKAAELESSFHLDVA